MVHPGEVVAEKYRVEREMAVGGMGVVVEATHLELDQRVALKFMLPDAAENASAVARFVREARAAVKLHSEHVGRVLDVGRLPSGIPYMVMEYLEGQDLSTMLDTWGALPIPSAVDYVVQACDAIAEAHSLGIVHRDLKPSNLFLALRSDGTGLIKVLDFGISKVTASGKEHEPVNITATSSLMGSPLYMSPEQMRSTKKVDARTDIWALGVILYELLAGRPPFDVESLPELCLMIANDSPPPLRMRRAEVPAELEAVIFKCLEKEQEKRFRNIAELAIALEPFASKDMRVLVERVARLMQVTRSEPVPGPAITDPQLFSNHAGGMAATVAAWGVTTSSRRKVRFAVAIAGGVVLAGIGVAALLLKTAGEHRAAGVVATADSTLVPTSNPSTHPMESASAVASSAREPEPAAPDAGAPLKAQEPTSTGTAKHAGSDGSGGKPKGTGDKTTPTKTSGTKKGGLDLDERR